MTLRRQIGIWRNIYIELATWNGAEASVDLSCACMFEREIGDGVLAGGMQHLDAALGGALTGLRRSEAFRGDHLETLLLDHLPSTVSPRALLVIGLGNPDTWTPRVSAMAASAAVRTAMQLRATSGAFAPSLLDAGFDGAAVSGAAQAMMQAVLDAIGAYAKVVESGLASAHRLRRWVFGVGTPHYERTAEQFHRVLSASAQMD